LEACPQSTRDSASLFGEPTAIVEAKNEGMFEVCFAGSKTRISCRSGELFVTVTDQPFDFCGPEADALKEAVRDKRKFKADEISRFLN
jgi:hypothetical protein